MDLLWAPWRSAYVAQATQSKHKGCTFCGILNARRDNRHYIFLRTAHSFAVLNIFPFNGGHVLVLPQRHVGSLQALTPQERVDLMDTVIRVQDLIQKVFAPEAFNIGMNTGRSAGAGIPDHLHVHIVPRWSGDVNFMPVLAGTKVMPVALKDAYARLKKGLAAYENKARDRKKRK